MRVAHGAATVETMAAFSFLDGALDRLVVPGYSKIGYAVRSRGWPADPAPDALHGKVAIVTGANSGLGMATAAGLAGLGARVRMVVRDEAKGERARAEVARQVPGAELGVEVCDVSSLADVRRFAEDFGARERELHLLVHNAGVLPAERAETPEGNELTLATHVFGPFLLTNRLLPLLRAGAPSRVIVMSSGGMYTQPLKLDDPQYRSGSYKGATAYARTKRMQVALVQYWGGRLAADGVHMHAMHPGWASTPGVAESLPGFNKVLGPLLRSSAQGADTAVWLAAADEPGRSAGGFWHDRARRPAHYLPLTRESPDERERLYEMCAAATGVAKGL